MARDATRKVSFFLTPTAPEEVVWRPPVDIYTTPDGWVVKFDLAGVRPEDIEFVIAGRLLTVRGSRRDFALEEGCRHYRMEIAYTHFERSVELPGDIDDLRFSTEHRDGMLLVRITKGQCK